MFVRQNQLVLLDANDVPYLDLTEEATPVKASKSGGSRLSRY